MKQISIVKTVLKLALVSVVGLLVACSSSDDGGVSTTSISGTIVAAPVNGAQVSVDDGNGNVVAGPVNTNASGQYTLDIPNGSLAQDMIVKSMGGTFTDEATGNNGTAGEMFAYVSANSLSDGANVCATPGSTIIAILVINHNKTMAEAEEAFTNAFGYAPDISVTPADATAPAVDASEVSKLAGLRAAAFSQLAMDLGLSQNNQFEMFAALAQDLSDGVLDAIDASGAVDIGSTGFALEANIQNRFATALLNFHNTGQMDDTHGNDQTGLANDRIGAVPFAKIALTNTYKIEYVPDSDMMQAVEGKTKFKLHITDKNTGAAEAGLMVTLMPMMHMADHKHSTPNVDCVAGVTEGDYDCAVYYLMASSMADGGSMGYWELKVMAGMDESVTFYPHVMMAMGDTAKVKLQAQTDGTDKVIGMEGEMNRKYFVFKDGLSGMGDARTFTMFVAALESMMSYPAVSVGTTLSSGTDDELLANPVTVEVSTDDGANWIHATDNGNGNWSADSVTGLVDGTAGLIHVRLTVNNEVKTTDGKAPDATATIINEYSSFTVTPGGM